MDGKGIAELSSTIGGRVQIRGSGTSRSVVNTRAELQGLEDIGWINVVVG